MGSAMVTDKMGSQSPPPVRNRGGDGSRKSTIGNRETERVDFGSSSIFSLRRLAGRAQASRNT
jgi:hypothetical protein